MCKGSGNVTNKGKSHLKEANCPYTKYLIQQKNANEIKSVEKKLLNNTETEQMNIVLNTKSNLKKYLFIDSCYNSPSLTDQYPVRSFYGP